MVNRLNINDPGLVITRTPLRVSFAGGGTDLSDFYNLSLKTPSKNDLADLPAGLRDFGRTRFDVRGILQLSGQMDAATGTNYPHRINGIKIGRKCYLFHFLHASSFEAHDGTDASPPRREHPRL